MPATMGSQARRGCNMTAALPCGNGAHSRAGGLSSRRRPRLPRNGQGRPHVATVARRLNLKLRRVARPAPAPGPEGSSEPGQATVRQVESSFCPMASEPRLGLGR